MADIWNEWQMLQNLGGGKKSLNPNILKILCPMFCKKLFLKY